MAMITSANNSTWPLDLDIKDIQESGLPVPSKIRMKLFTLDTRLVIKKIGVLSTSDQEAVQEKLKQLLCI
ncbi:MAG: transcriptional modulator of MazE/toxin MazF [Desulfobulbus propionicus]|nr:MAG: transcriptional modulator of MazE/toxin MazF [Desulfobulbus propionicus]